jgi:uncharacterized membrane protein YphA (DoxX/SURF4 family)
LNTILWIIQILLAILFTLFGLMLLTTPHEKILEKVTWAKNFSPRTTKLIGLVELLGAIGLIVPMATGILPWLTPLAAIGLVLNMIGAIVTHLRYREYPNVIFPIILLLLAAFVAYGRLVLVPA